MLIGSRPFDLLRVLLEHAGELVSKDRLLEQAWTRLVVEESNLHVQVSQLRKLIGADAIATVVGLGYCFAVPLLNATPQRAYARHADAMVGRAAAIADAKAQLRSTRLLTLLGIGAVGKTRLAHALARRATSAATDQGLIVGHALDATKPERIDRATASRPHRTSSDRSRAWTTDPCTITTAGTVALPSGRKRWPTISAGGPRIRVQPGPSTSTGDGGTLGGDDAGRYAVKSMR